MDDVINLVNCEFDDGKTHGVTVTDYIPGVLKSEFSISFTFRKWFCSRTSHSRETICRFPTEKSV